MQDSARSAGLALLVLAACSSGPHLPPPLEPGQEADDPAAAPVKVHVGPVAVTAPILQPDALAAIEWPDPSLRTPEVAAQRKKFDKARPAARQKEGRLLATALWQTGARDDARTLLRELAAAADAPEDTLRLLAAAERLAGDHAAAGAVYDKLFERFPKSPDHERDRAQRAWLALRSGDTAAAETIIKDADMKLGEAHDVVAWIKLRRGDVAGAHAAINRAVDTWSDYASWDAVVAESYLFAALDGTPAETMLVRMNALLEDGPPRQKVRTHTGMVDRRKVVVIEADIVVASALRERVRLARAYLTAGRVVDARAVIVHLAEPAAEEQFDAARTAYLLARLAEIDGRPITAAAEMTRAWTRLAAFIKEFGADEQVDQSEVNAFRAELDAGTLALARAYRAYALASGDAEYARAADQLYGLIGQQAAPDASPPAPADAKAVRGAMLAELVRRNLPVLAACYLLPLQQDPKLAGTVDVAGEVADGGAVAVSTSDGLAGVAACVGARVSEWSAPGGGTSFTLALQFAP